MDYGGKKGSKKKVEVYGSAMCDSTAGWINVIIQKSAQILGAGDTGSESRGPHMIKSQ